MHRLQFSIVASLVLAAGAACQATHSTRQTSTQSPTPTSQANKAPAQTVAVSEVKPVAKPASAPKATKAPSSRRAAASMAFPTGDANTSALLVEYYTPGEVRVGEVFDGEILVQNLTSMALDNVIVTQTLDTNLQVVRLDPPAVEGREGMHTWSLGTIPANSAKTIAIRGSAKEARSINSCIAATYNSAMCANVAVVAPALKLTAYGPAEVTQCDEIVYKYVVTNSGSGQARDVVVNANLPAGLTPTSGSASQQVGTLDAGQSKEITLTLQAARNGVFEHTAAASAGDKLTAKATGVTTKVIKPSIKLEGTGTPTIFVGREVGYDFTVSNVGDGASRDFFVAANVPAGMTFKSATEGGKLAGNVIRWDLGNFKTGDSKKLSARLVAGQIGSAQITATTNGYCADEVKATVRTDITGIPALLLEVLDVHDPILVGDDEVYVIEVTNQGTAPATNVVISIDVPDTALFMSSTGTTKSAAATVDSAGKLAMLPLNSLAPKAKASWRITVRGVKPADARFGVQMTSDQLSTPVNETEATTYYQ